MLVPFPGNIKFSHNFYSLPAESIVTNSYLKMNNSELANCVRENVYHKEIVPAQLFMKFVWYL
jgi:hypothetical protein